MNDKAVKINYLFNSGFAVETEKHLLIFDYYMDSVNRGEKCIANGAVGDKDLNTEKNIIVFSSHSHADHFNPVILEWAKLRPDIKYILSNDISVDKPSSNIHMMAPYEELALGDTYIKAFGSTDLGGSFLVKVDSLSIFHSGDLNWWYWWDDTKEEIEKAETWFKEEIERIKGEEIDIAFFPVDPRLEHNYYVGGEYFIKELKPKNFIPMHFGVDYDTTKKFKDKMKEYDVEIFEIKDRGEQIDIRF